ncbi:hypothetical protein J4481_00945 [Candidatus Pacearchaeota archaeon]|nr:hypothetical protein [Candidatus Pacearchaeota archaeon]
MVRKYDKGIRINETDISFIKDVIDKPSIDIWEYVKEKYFFEIKKIKKCEKKNYLTSKYTSLRETVKKLEKKGILIKDKPRPLTYHINSKSVITKNSFLNKKGKYIILFFDEFYLVFSLKCEGQDSNLRKH